jgi:undecaprenyl-diphosphatase
MDTAILHAINGLAGRSSVVDWIMLQLGYSSTLLVFGLLVMAYWLWRARRDALVGGVAAGGLLVLGDFIGAQVKILVERVRPCRVLETVQQLTTCGGTFSFPSNHALNTAALAAFAQVLYPQFGWVLWPVVGLAGISRIYVGAHYPSDVLGGWVLGGLLGASLGLLTKRVLKTNRRPELPAEANVPR